MNALGRSSVRHLKAAIITYGITSEDLFNSGDSKPRSMTGAADKTVYSDGKGRTWGGRGPRPTWLREAIAGGRSLENFAAAEDGGASQQPSRRGGVAKSTGPVAIKYRDGDNTWAGRGSQPRWLKAALVEGKQLEQFRV